MNKNDKIIAIIGVAVLIIASVGIYTWTPEETLKPISSIDSFFTASSRWKPRNYAHVRAQLY